MVTKKVHLKGADEALRLFGQHDQNLRYLEQSFGVQIFGRGDVLSVRGAPGKVEKALVAIDEMREHAVQEGNGSETFAASSAQAPSGAATYTSALGKAVRPRTATQKAYVSAIERKDLVIAIGAGRDRKTYLAVACALAALKEDRVSKIVLTRPVVGSGGKIRIFAGVISTRK